VVSYPKKMYLACVHMSAKNGRCPTGIWGTPPSVTLCHDPENYVSEVIVTDRSIGAECVYVVLRQSMMVGGVVDPKI
jgi:hypothetical protein